jgi:cobalt-zinc-cadmium efflux system membrane fusion protein
MINFSSQQLAGKPNKYLALLLLAVSCNSHDHSVAVVADDGELDPIAITVFTDKAELFMEYPHLVVGESASFLAHVTVMQTGEPVRSGQLRLEMTSASANEDLRADKPKRDGLFVPIATFDTAGEYNARIVVESEQLSETITLPTMVVHADQAGAVAAAEADQGPEPADAVPFLLEAQWKIGLLMKQAQRHSLTERLQVAGQVEAPQHGMAVASAPLGGRLLPPEGGSLPRIGDKVKKGQLLAFVEPPLTASDLAQLSATAMERENLEAELLLREFDLQAKILEMEQSLQESKAELRFARQSLTRVEALHDNNLGTVAELEEARKNLAIAEEEAVGAENLKKSYLQAQQQIAALKASSSGSRNALGITGPVLHPMLAPISGEIVSAAFVEGETVESQAALYRVLDPTHVWINVQVSEFELGRIGVSPGALLQFAAFPERAFDITEDLQGRLIHSDRIVDPQTRTVSLRFEVTNPQGLLRVGMFADVFLETKRSVDVVAIPESAIVMDNGGPIAFVLLDGETFQKRTLQLGIRDGSMVEVVSGIEEGDRVVTYGAYLVKLASASPASFGAGHAH